MEDAEVLLENEPLAIYLKNLNITDFADFKTRVVEVPNPQDLHLNKKYANSYEFQIYLENILKSELLFDEDINILQTCMTVHTPKTFSIYRNLFCGSLTGVTLGVGIAHYSTIAFKYLATSCLLPFLWFSYTFINKCIKRNKILFLLEKLNKFTDLTKKSLRLVGELSKTIGYYSPNSLCNSSIRNLHSCFAEKLYAILLTATNLLATSSHEIISFVPLKSFINLPYNIEQNFFEKSDIKLADIKLLYEFYLLVQSDFIKTFGLSFCHDLWTMPDCDASKVTTIIIPNVFEKMNDIIKLLNSEYLIIQNFGLMDNKNNTVKTPQKFKNVPLNYINICLRSSELHFQQLLCKARDVQNIVIKLDSSDINKEGIKISEMLTEIDIQLNASKNMLDAAIKHLNHILHMDLDEKSELKPQLTITHESTKVMDCNSEPVASGNEIYELYIPKEGLSVLEEEIDKPVFSINQVGYYGVLLDELKRILKARNPEMFQGEYNENISQSSDSDDEQNNRNHTKDIFRPEQPTGLAESLLNISTVLKARRNLIQSEEAFDCTVSNSDSD